MSSLAAIAAARAQVETARKANASADTAYRMAGNAYNQAHAAMIQAQATLRAARAELTRLESERALTRRLAGKPETARQAVVLDQIESLLQTAIAESIEAYRRNPRPIGGSKGVDLGDRPRATAAAVLDLMNLVAPGPEAS